MWCHAQDGEYKTNKNGNGSGAPGANDGTGGNGGAGGSNNSSNGGGGGASQVNVMVHLIWEVELHGLAARISDCLDVESGTRLFLWSGS